MSAEVRSGYPPPTASYSHLPRPSTSARARAQSGMHACMYTCITHTHNAYAYYICACTHAGPGHEAAARAAVRLCAHRRRPAVPEGGEAARAPTPLAARLLLWSRADQDARPWAVRTIALVLYLAMPGHTLTHPRYTATTLGTSRAACYSTCATRTAPGSSTSWCGRPNR